MRKLKFFKKYLIVLMIVLLIGLGIVILVTQSNSTYKIPTQIKKQLDFSVLYPTSPFGAWTLKPNSTTYSRQENHQDDTFSFILKSGSQTITISEQAYPDALIYDNLTNGIGPYDEVGTLYGKLTLGRPKYLNGGQAVVLNYSNQTLIFGHPSRDVTKQQWQTIFNSLEPVKG